MQQPFISQSVAKFFKDDAVNALRGIRRGIEKESLRISTDGRISQQPHPVALGSALTNPFITTDYSEALLELITPAYEPLDQAQQMLREIHRFTYQEIGEELLWVTSMPCVMGDESSIPIAQYGKSNSGRMKTLYRHGLGHRYGRFMQTIAGIHYNFSFSDSLWEKLFEFSHGNPAATSEDFSEFKSERYMGLIRNYLRYGWLIPLFFGASPALCKSFLQGRQTDLDELVPGTIYGRYATSLRMSDLGYQNKAQSRLNVRYNNLPGYIKALERAIRTPDPLYEKIGVKVDGEYRQLNANLLQIENEFYGNIRPKRVSKKGERPTKALANGGIEYIEVRALDLNPFVDIGIASEQTRFIDAFLLFCLMADSLPITEREEGENQENLRRIVKYGRKPGLCLLFDNREASLNDIVAELLDHIGFAAELLDSAYAENAFSQSVNDIRRQMNDLQLTLSGKIIETIENRADGFFPYAMELSRSIKNQILEQPLSEEKINQFKLAAKISLQRQKEIEASDNLTFEDYLAAYYS